MGVCLALFFCDWRGGWLSSVFFARVVLVCGVASVNLLLAGALLFFILLNVRSLCVAVVCIEVIQDLSCLQWVERVLSICGGSCLVYVEPADISLEGRLGCESSSRCPLFFPQGRIQSRCPRIFQLTACCRVAPSFVAVALVERGTEKRVRSKASAGLWERGRDKRWWHKGGCGTLVDASKTVSVSLFAEQGAPCRTGTHTGRYPHTHTSARGHVAYARVYTQTLCRFRDTGFDDFSRGSERSVG